jgi:hypothetical protein
MVYDNGDNPTLSGLSQDTKYQHLVDGSSAFLRTKAKVGLP